MLHHRTMENFNEHFKAIFDVHGQIPTKGKTNTARFGLGAVFLSTNWGCFIVTSEGYNS